MARLKVKQISDFTSAVNSLIGTSQVAVDDSIDSLESQLSEGLDSLGIIDSAVSNALATEISTTDTEVGSLEVIDSAISNALATEISTTDTEIGSLEVIQSAVSNALATEISTTDTEVGSLEVIDSAISNALTALDTEVGNIDIASLEAIDSAVSNAVAGILQGADANTDNFSEVISYINSVDAASDLDLVAEMASVDTRFGGIDTKVGSLEVIDSAISNALATEISTTDTEIGSLEVIDSAVSNALTNLQNNVGDINQPSLEVIDSAISNALAAEISTTDTEVGSLEVIDSAISNALATEISTTDGEITAINASIDSLELYNLVFEQGGTVGSTTQFTLSQPVKFGVNDDLLVFINGHNVHKNGAVEGATEGYETADGLTFDLISIGYDIDATDHVTVVGIRQ